MAVKSPRAEKPDYRFPLLMLAPIAGVNDRAAREIAREHGCPLTFSELVSARGLQERNAGSMQMLEECRGEHPLVFQIFGSEPDSVYDAVRMAEELGVEGVNLNLGCPVKKVFKNRSGCGLSIFPADLVRVLRAMRKAAAGHLSVKIRAGVNLNSLNYRIIGDIAQGEGCDAVIFHARTRLMGFGGEAQWDWIADLKQYLDIPVIGNGDAVDPISTKKMLDYTHCDGVMIGRGAYGNPWIFRRILHFLDTGEILPEPELEERINVFLHHHQLAVQWKGERKAIFEMRKHLGWYVKGWPNVKNLRERVYQLESFDEIALAVREWLESALSIYDAEKMVGYASL
ncbi:MAG: tRNA dihydrouridine synthase DusB [Candidatus Omnitrophota bacterium]